ncbi:MAG: hypothetical protein IJY62_03260 [Clostridia bacterium]|nr:hypothetical protein [Clostridia bacterium]
MSFGFIDDLNEYFCEKYADYDKICILKGYVMPKMHATERRADGRDYSYTLPASTMRLAAQAKKAELLAELKEKMFDPSFSFSFRPLGFFTRIRDKFKKVNFRKTLEAVLSRNSLTKEEALSGLALDPWIWEQICKGKYYPTKNLVFSLALSAHLPSADMHEMLDVCDLALDYTSVKDVVISYLVEKRIFNADMVRAALEEYKLKNLFVKGLESEDEA